MAGQPWLAQRSARLHKEAHRRFRVLKQLGMLVAQRVGSQVPQLDATLAAAVRKGVAHLRVELRAGNDLHTRTSAACSHNGHGIISPRFQTAHPTAAVSEPTPSAPSMTQHVSPQKPALCTACGLCARQPNQAGQS